ncbi:carbonic anhydrase [Gloeothece verrucosa]|uniref:Carbonic anhydrase n=1 Tax=Gloeothece verrucosa (strain PCC 7822) TaxID=497965 RepID=E0UES9_GLOV7|nr:carbonic anhydrase [Gloeothece verrucosa]ADN13059.1 Carbonate dehydratase [Gloeothece verrucosa PCC 7822]
MKKLIEGLEKFQSGYFSLHRDLFEELAHGQTPRILFITCSDSRIDPNLITQAQVGELFVIRNAGNMIPPYGATNGGEGAALEYAVHALGIEQIIVCGHSHCGAMKGLLKLNTLAEEMPLVYDWLKQAEATRRVVKDNYKDLQGEELLEVTVAENVLTQLENLQTYPIIRSKLHQNKLLLEGWIYRIETGEIFAYDSVLHDFVPPHSRLPAPEHEYNFHPSCSVKNSETTPEEEHISRSESSPKSGSNGNGHSNSATSSINSHLSAQQWERIYRGSNR